MNEEQLFSEIAAAKNALGMMSRKFSGSVTTELIRQALLDSGVSVSGRDVFIRGLPLEIDLLVISSTARPTFGILYKPEDVLGCVEVKNAGSFGESTIQTTRKAFAQICAAIPKTQCFYVSVSERFDYPWAITEANVGVRCFTLFNYSGSGKRYKLWPTGDWSKLVETLHELAPS